jgi:bifunctional non-homologous end joining protein LigD
VNAPSTLPPVLDGLPEPERARLRRAPEDRSTLIARPMLASLSDRRVFDDRWIFERKLDGVRALGVREDDRTWLLSRTGRVMDATYPELVQALASQECQDFVVDGEIVALRAGRTDFSLLQQRMGLTDPRAVRASRVAVTYYLFDLLLLDGWDLTGLPQRTRKNLLRRALRFHGPLRYTPHRNHDPARGAAALLNDACAKHWEGLIAKRADAPYQPRRSTDWLKLKCEAGQEFVIAGFTEPGGSRIGFGALLLGYYDPAGPSGPPLLRYAGKVGTGFSDRALLALRDRLDALSQPHSPFSSSVPERAPHWVAPCLVAQVAFTEWTSEGLLRHPRFLALRPDQPPTAVLRETPF